MTVTPSIMKINKIYILNVGKPIFRPEPRWQAKQDFIHQLKATCDAK